MSIVIALSVGMLLFRFLPNITKNHKHYYLPRSYNQTYTIYHHTILYTYTFYVPVGLMCGMNVVCSVKLVYFGIRINMYI